MEDEKRELEQRICNDSNVDINLEDYKSYEELENHVSDNNLCDEEVIYYSTAMEYLKENDTSLHESMEIASEYGYETGSINSELLASLLKSQNNRNDFYAFQGEIEEYYSDYEDCINEKIETIEEIVEYYTELKEGIVFVENEFASCENAEFKINLYTCKIETGNSLIEKLEELI